PQILHPTLVSDVVPLREELPVTGRGRGDDGGIEGEQRASCGDRRRDDAFGLGRDLSCRTVSVGEGPWPFALRLQWTALVPLPALVCGGPGRRLGLLFFPRRGRASIQQHRSDHDGERRESQSATHRILHFHPLDTLTRAAYSLHLPEVRRA